MRKGASARDQAGFLAQHADAFKEVARQSNCIIMSRSPGFFTPGLVSEGYSSKGFHNKAKSCNWGPMAGFVCLEPRFSKIGLTDTGVKTQREHIRKALLHGATPVQIFISDTRLDVLYKSGYLKRCKPSTASQGKKGRRVWRFTPTMKDCHGTFVDDAANYIFTLSETTIGGKTYWGLFYQTYPGKPTRPVKALRDPSWAPIELVQDSTGIQFQKANLQPDFKKATTGDYDLFACWGQANDPNNDYERPVGAKDLNSIADLNLKEDENQGNISPFLSQVATALNYAISHNRWGDGPYSYRGGDMVHHSDEAGRPFISDIDFPFIAFFPPSVCDIPQAVGQTIVSFETVQEFRDLIARAQKWGYNVELNPGWVKELAGGNATLKKQYQKLVIKGKEYQGII